MKIAHLICKFPPYRGGMGNVAYEQVKRLAEMGHEVTVFTLDQKEKLDPQTINFKIEYLNPLLRLGNGGFCPQIIKKLKDFDVIQLHYPFFGVQEVLWLGKKLGLIKAKLVITYHMDASFDNWFLKLLSFKSWLIRRSLFKIAKQVCSASLDYVRHSKIKNIYHKYQDKFVEIPFGISHSPDQISRERLEKVKQQIHWQGGEKNILFVGNLDRAHYFKGVDILLKAFYKLQVTSYKLLIIGDGDLRFTYEKQAEELKISDRVYFAGRVSDEDLPCYYYLSDVVVLPSITKAEAFGLVLAEAESFGKPVIASDLPGVRSVVGEAGLLAKPGDIDDLAEKLKIILSNENLRQQFSAAGLNQVKAKYNWDEHVEKLNQLYKKTGE
ncbi:glycosyltransferase [Candidatus Kuenenbacteria bacterium]|nr:glycosyltransferase [Candidatus Kuenenbacteria bacterium]